MDDTRGKQGLACVARKLSTFESLGNRILVTNSTASGIYEPSPLLEVGKEFVVNKATSTFVERAVDRDNITLT